MASPLEHMAAYQAAFHDFNAALKLARATRDKGLCSVSGVEQIFRDELVLRWQRRIDIGELPPCYAPHQVMEVSEAAASLLNTPAEIR